MKYYSVCFNSNVKQNTEKYIVKQNETKDVFMISFDDHDIDSIIQTVDSLIFVDENRKLYRIKGKELISTGEKLGISVKKWYRQSCKTFMILHKQESYAEKNLAKSDITCINKRGYDLLSYRAFTFADKENNALFPFRFRKSKGDEKQPLVVYFCGAGSIGTDNLKPYFEFVTMLSDIRKYNCNVLIPQPSAKVNFGKSNEELNYNIDNYVTSVYGLIRKLVKENNIDTNRIYITGVSLGGYCTWRSAYLFQDFYACAMPVVGRFDMAVENSAYGDFERLKNIPIWVAHSVDDKIVGIEYDDYAVEKLKELGANIKYTRWNKYGHGMASRFYGKEKWCQWMFEQKNNP